MDKTTHSESCKDLKYGDETDSVENDKNETPVLLTPTTQETDHQSAIDSSLSDGTDTGEESETLAEETERAAEIRFAAKALAIGLAAGILIGGISLLLHNSVQSAFANKLIKQDTCPTVASSPSGFCFDSAVSVAFIANNPLSQIAASQANAVISASQSRIGIFGRAKLNMRLSGLSGASPASNAPLSNTRASQVTGTLSLAYSALTSTLQSGSNSKASIFYVGNNQIGTSNQVSYQGQQITLTVISKIELKNNLLYLTPETVNALNHSAPASSVFSSVAPVPVDIAVLPTGMHYTGLTLSKKLLTFEFSGQRVELGSLFNSKAG